jgi:hypothetical protein
VSENGPAKRRDNRLFLQALRVMNLLSEKVYVSGLTSLWPEITRIPNIPQRAPQLSCLTSGSLCQKSGPCALLAASPGCRACRADSFSPLRLCGAAPFSPPSRLQAQRSPLPRPPWASSAGDCDAWPDPGCLAAEIFLSWPKPNTSVTSSALKLARLRFCADDKVHHLCRYAI